MTNKELIEQMRALQEMGATMVDTASAASLCDRLEAAEAEIEAHTKWVQSAEQNFHSLEEKIDKLKGLIRWVKGWIEYEEWRLFPDGPEKAEIEKIVGEG